MKKTVFSLLTAAALSVSIVTISVPAHSTAAPAWTTDFSNQDLAISITNGELTYAVDTRHLTLTFAETASTGVLGVSANTTFVPLACDSAVTAAAVNVALVPGCKMLFPTLTGVFNPANRISKAISASSLTGGQTLSASETSILLNSGYKYLVAMLQISSTTDTLFIPFSGAISGGSSSTEATDTQPNSFGGALIARAERSIVDGTGSMTLFGKRLFTIASATIGGIEVEMVRATRADRSLVLSFTDLPVGVHDLVLHTTNGKMTFRGAVTIK